MAIYYADVTLGNDANSGTAPGAGNAKKTASAATALATGVGDAVEFAAGTYPLTANITVTNISGVTFRSAPGLSNTAVQFTGNFLFALSGAGKWRFINLNFKNYTGSSSSFTTNNTYSNVSFEDCVFDGASSASSRALASASGSTSCNNCIFKNLDIVNVTAIGAVFENCIFQDIVGTNGTVSANSLNCDFIGCTFIKVKNCLDLSSNTTTIRQDLTAFRYCTFDLKDAYGVGSHGYIYRHASATNLTVEGYRFSNNLIYRTAKIIHDASAGQLTIASAGTIKNNWIQSGTNVTRYNSSGGDVTGNSDPLFYDASTNDYRLEPTSTAAVGNNGLANTMGANELEAPTTFFTDPGVANVLSPTVYKFNQRVGNNRTGTLPQQYPLLPASDVRLGVDRGDGTFGTYDPITGVWEAVSAADLRSGVSKKQNGITVVGLLNLPALGEVKSGVTFDNGTKTGTRTDANPANVKTGTGTYGAGGTEITPSYNPDFPSRSSVLENDTVDNLAGLLPLDSVIEASGGNYEEADPAFYKLGETYGPSGSIVGTYTAEGMPPEEWVLDGKVYGGGSLTGKLGRIVTSNMDITPQIRDNINTLLSNYLTGWTEMGYLLDEDLNNFKGNLKKYGVVPGQMRALGLLYGQESIEREFEIKLITRYINKGNTDKSKRAAGDEILTKLEEIRRRGTATNYGSFNSVMNVSLAEEPELEYLNADEIVVGKLTIRITFSVDRLN